jgi:hypothetical protein
MSGSIHSALPGAPVAGGASGQQVTVVQPQPSAVPSLETLGGWAAAILAIAALVALIAKLMTKDQGRDLRDTANQVTQLDHKLRNQVVRIDSLEHLRVEDITRIVKLETIMQNMQTDMARIIHGQEKLADTMTANFQMLAESIREVRTVTARV